MPDQPTSHYQILRNLGAGGMGEVYEAEDLRLGRHAALKFLPESIAKDPHALERIRHLILFWMSQGTGKLRHLALAAA